MQSHRCLGSPAPPGTCQLSHLEMYFRFNKLLCPCRFPSGCLYSSQNPQVNPLMGAQGPRPPFTQGRPSNPLVTMRAWKKKNLFMDGNGIFYYINIKKILEEMTFEQEFKCKGFTMFPVEQIANKSPSSGLQFFPEVWYMV